MKKIIPIVLATILTPLISSCRFCMKTEAFSKVENGQFISDGNPHYYLGTNFWYGPILASDTKYADMPRLEAELDSLKALGLTNLRVLVGADGPEGAPSKISPVLQPEPGVYDENVFKGLDRFLYELSKRDMKAVLYITNTWEWSGGYGQYLKWAGRGEIVRPNDGWEEFREYTSQIMLDDKAKEMVENHIKTVVSRVNTVTGKPYSEDPTIFAWQIANEPRCLSYSEEIQEAFVKWIWKSAELIKSIDPNHMVSTGNEGLYGCEMNMELFEKLHACPAIDYLTIHIWPFNWSWISKETVTDSVNVATEKAIDYIKDHCAIAAKYNKPLVVEEFGYPRDGFQFAKESPVTARDSYYKEIFDQLIDSKENEGSLAGLNFWGWGGLAKQNPTSVWWSQGDDFCCDPAQEQQGLYSVYLSDKTTIDIIKYAQKQLSEK